MDNNKKTAREKRGQTTKTDDNKFLDKTEDELIGLLNSENPKIRTSAAKILGKRKSEKAIPFLCKRIKIEQALYSRIAISEAFVSPSGPIILI